MKKHQCGDWGKPYIRRANGRERSGTIRLAFQLAWFRMTYKSGFYVLVQRGVKNEVLACGKSRTEIIRSLVGCFFERFNSWANEAKLLSVGSDTIRKRLKPGTPLGATNLNRYMKRSIRKRVLAPKNVPF